MRALPSRVLKTYSRISQVLTLVTLAGAVVVSGISCGIGSDDVPVEALVDAYCGTCHLTPKPDLLPKETWEHTVLPRMGYFYGIYGSREERTQLIESNAGGKLVEASGVFPKEPVIGMREWTRICEFYIESAPEQLSTSTSSIDTSSSVFKPTFPSLYLSPPSTTMVKWNSLGELMIGDAHSQKLMLLDDEYQIRQAANVRESAVWAEEINSDLWVTVMGQFSPTDDPSGFILKLPGTAGEAPGVVIKGLQRPVHASYGDLHGDGIMDIVVSEFGKWTGGLTMFEGLEDGSFKKHVIFNSPGATRSYLRDMNGDRRTDIVALFGQGNEGIDIFYNQGNSEFTRHRVLRFSPSHGSSFFDLFDMNGDGFLDIIYTAGDNADFKPVLKPYHGVYVYQNNGLNEFQEILHLQLNGAYSAVPADFDLDGDIDIAAISFFPDWEASPEEGFVYFENTGDDELLFRSSSFPGVDQGRWIVMDAADKDSDGDLDLVLGSLAFEVIPDGGQVQRWTQNGIPFVILENQTR